MTEKEIKKIVDLSSQLNDLDKIDRVIIKGSRDHWWGINDAGSNNQFIPDILRGKIIEAVRESISEITKELESIKIIKDEQ